MSNHPIVIIGTGLAGYTLGKEIRKFNPEAPLLYITSDDGAAYSKPMLSTGFTKKQTATDLAMKDAGAMAAELKASIRTFCKVTAIVPGDHAVVVGEEVIHYSKLVLAWGAHCIEAPLHGDGEDHVYSINDLLDYDKFRKAAEGKQRVFIIGAGLIGCEYANDMLNGGFQVEAVEPMPTVLGTLLPPQASHAVQRALEEKGVKYNFGTVAEDVNKVGDELEITLANGVKTRADIVVSAIGVRPRVELAKDAGLKTNRGVVVNRQLQTSDTDIYALGDCAEVEGHVLYYVMPLMNAARALGKTLTGIPTDVVYPAMPVGIKTPACPVQVNPPPRGAEGEWEITENGNNVKALFRNPAGQLLGFALTGDACSEKMALTKELPPVLV